MSSQRKFVDRNELPYRLLCDPNGEMIRSYGVRGLFGFAKRISFLIDSDWRIARRYTSVSPAGHAREVLEDLRSLTPGRTP